MSAAEDFVSSLTQTMSNALEEIFGWIGEEPSIGDNGVAEHLISIENDLMFVKRRLHERSTQTTT